MELVKRVHAQNIVKWGKTHKDVIVLSGDLTSSCEIDGFREAFPDRFLSMGLMEQNMMSFAAGLAREGLTPLVHTFAVFMYRRSLDQIEMSIAYPNLPVKIFGFLPGVTTPGGASHQAINDIAVMRSLPNMTVIETGDATDVESVIKLSCSVDGPVYIRMLRGELPRLFPKKNQTVLGKARILSSGSDITLLTSGICTEESLRITPVLKDHGIGVQHLHISTLKPFNDQTVSEALVKAKYGIITMENHTSEGGLGTCVAEQIAKCGISTKLKKIAISDKYLEAGSREFLIKRFNIDAQTLVDTVESFVGKNIKIPNINIPTVKVNDYFNDNQQEAL